MLPSKKKKNTAQFPQTNTSEEYRWRCRATNVFLHLSVAGRTKHKDAQREKQVAQCCCSLALSLSISIWALCQCDCVYLSSGLHSYATALSSFSPFTTSCVFSTPELFDLAEQTESHKRLKLANSWSSHSTWCPPAVPLFPSLFIFSPIPEKKPYGNGHVRMQVSAKTVQLKGQAVQIFHTLFELFKFYILTQHPSNTICGPNVNRAVFARSFVTIDFLPADKQRTLGIFTHIYLAAAHNWSTPQQTARFQFLQESGVALEIRAVHWRGPPYGSHGLYSWCFFVASLSTAEYNEKQRLIGCAPAAVPISHPPGRCPCTALINLCSWAETRIPPPQCPSTLTLEHF